MFSTAILSVLRRRVEKIPIVALGGTVSTIGANLFLVEICGSNKENARGPPPPPFEGEREGKGGEGEGEVEICRSPMRQKSVVNALVCCTKPNQTEGG